MEYYLIGSLLLGGLYLHKTPRIIEKQRKMVSKEDRPSGKNIYSSTRWKEVQKQVLDKSEESYRKSYDPYNNNVLPVSFNQLGSVSDYHYENQVNDSDRLSKLIQGRGNIKESQKPSFINDGGLEIDINQSPMFANNNNIKAMNTQTLKDRNTGGFDLISDPSTLASVKIEDRKGNNYNTKMEHFSNYTLHGPMNSNDPMKHNNMVPFFGSKGTQNMNPMVNQQRLENFTGQTNSVTEFRSRPKHEIASLQDLTPDQSYIYGTPVDNEDRRTERYWTSTLKTNVLPDTQERVGPGLNYGMGKTGRDGFHPKYRPTYRNVDELRVNKKDTYEGRVKAGKELVSNRGLEGSNYKRRPDRFYINDDRRYFKGASFSKDKKRENFFAYKTDREDSNVEYFGIAANPDATAPKPRLKGQSVMNCNDTINGEVQHTMRNQFPHAEPRNYFSGTDKHDKYDYGMSGYYAHPEERDTTEFQVGKQRLNPFSNQGSEQHPYDNARVTTRQTLNVKNYKGIAGKSDIQNTMSYENMYNAVSDNKKEDVLVGAIYGPNKNTNITIGACDVNMQITDRTGYDGSKYGYNPDKLYTGINTIDVNYDNTTSKANRDQENPYEPKLFVVDQFKDNPYTQSLTSAVRMN